MDKNEYLRRHNGLEPSSPVILVFISFWLITKRHDVCGRVDLSSSVTNTRYSPIFTARKRSLRRLCFYMCLSFILFTGGGVVVVVSQHAMGQQYIRSCISVESQLVWRQHTGNIKCMMG